MKNDFKIMKDHVIIYAIRKDELLEIIVDKDDFKYLKKWSWSIGTDSYVVRNVIENGKQKLIRMHRLVNKTPDNMETDHINGNKLDNRKCNLRSCNHVENHANKNKQKGEYSSRFKGVSWSKVNKKWQAQIFRDNKVINIGYFDKEEVAAFAYNIYAKKYSGEFAKLNKVNLNM